jgi:hypothetical protein
LWGAELALHTQLFEQLRTRLPVQLAQTKVKLEARLRA